MTPQQLRALVMLLDSQQSLLNAVRELFDIQGSGSGVSVRPPDASPSDSQYLSDLEEDHLAEELFLADQQQQQRTDFLASILDQQAAKPAQDGEPS